MPIIYSVVARGATVLAEYSSASGNFDKITQRILEKIPPQNNKMSYVYDRHIFHYIVEGGIVYLCMADEEFGRRAPFTFLEDIKSRFQSQYGGQALSAPTKGMNMDFSKTLQKQMDYFSNNPNADKVSKVRGEIDEVKSVMVQNIERVLERGERIELLVDRTENLNQQAFNFKKQSTHLKRSMWWQNTKLTVAIVIVVIIIIYFIIAAFCGLTFQDCGAKK